MFANTTIIAPLPLLIGLALLGTICSPKSQAERPDDQPNIVILLADDLGWNDVGYHGSSIKTPNLDRFVREGIELDRFYAAPYCVPTRAGLLTGRYPHRFALRYKSNFSVKATLPAGAVTLAELLADAGYAHRGCVGKWHLGDGPQQHPLGQGFSHFYGMLGGMVHYFDHRTIPFGPNANKRPRLLDWHRNHDDCHDEGYTTDLIGTEAIRFLRTTAGKQPFFLYVAFNAPHLPLQAKPEALQETETNPDDASFLFSGDAKTNRALLAAMVASLDDNLGRILAAIDQQGLRQSTLVLFLSDNGGYDRFGISDNSPLRGGKGTTWEGGVRVPAAVRLPGTWRGGRKVTEPLAYIDVLPTLAHLAGADIPRNIDGANVAAILSGDEESLARKIYLGPGTITDVKWKLRHQELFAIDTEPGETKNVADKQPDVVVSLRAELGNVEPPESPRKTRKATNRSP